MPDEFPLPSLADESCSRYFSSVSSATEEFRNFLPSCQLLTNEGNNVTFESNYPRPLNCGLCPVPRAGVFLYQWRYYGAQPAIGTGGVEPDARRVNRPGH